MKNRLESKLQIDSICSIRIFGQNSSYRTKCKTQNKALTNILHNAIELNLDLEVQDCKSIYTLVFHVHRPIAVAAAEFLNNKLFVKEKFVIFKMVDNFNKTYIVKI